MRALTIDFAAQKLFWVDGCNHRLESVHISGDQISSVFSVQLHVGFTSQGISIFNNYLYWQESGSLGTILKRMDRISAQTVEEVSMPLRGLFGGVEVVHPNKQPDGMFGIVNICGIPRVFVKEMGHCDSDMYS